MIVTMSA
jgi:hypothetical protein